MSFEDLLTLAIGRIGERLQELIFERCFLSRTGAAIGYRGVTKKGKYFGRITIVRCRKGRIYLGKNNRRFRPDDKLQVMQLKRIRAWKILKPLHPLEALARAADSEWLEAVKD